MKSSGKRFSFRLTAWLRTFVATPYKSAKSRSSITFCPRIGECAKIDTCERMQYCHRSSWELWFDPRN